MSHFVFWHRRMMLLKQKVFWVHDLPYRQPVYLRLTILWLPVLSYKARILADRLMEWMRHANMTEACRSCYIPNCNGLMYLRDSRSCLTSWCSALCLANLLSSYLISVNRPLMSHHCRLSDLPADDFRSHTTPSGLCTWAFSVADPLVWNSLSDNIRAPRVGRHGFRHILVILFTNY